MQLTQKQMYYRAIRQLGDRDMAFMDMLECKINPLTSDDLKKLMKRFPQRWERYKGFLPMLEAREEA